MLIRENEGLKLKITAPPVDGKANAFVIKYLSKELKVPKSSIHLIRGQTSHHKVFEFETLYEENWNKYHENSK